MADLSHIHVNDAGVLLQIIIEDNSGPVDLSGADSIILLFEKPDRTFFERPCEILNAPAGLIQYMTTVDDLDQAGRWRLQVVIVFDDTTIKHSDVGKMAVAKNIPL